MDANNSSSQITPKKNKFFRSRNSSGSSGGGQKRPSSASSSSPQWLSPRTPDSPIQRKARRVYNFRKEKDSLYDSGLDDSASEADLASPPRYFTNLMASGGAKSLQSEDKFFCLANEFDASTPVKKQRSSPLLPPPKQNIWQDALEKNPELKAFVEKFKAEMAELDKMELDVVDLEGNPITRKPK
ncbi:hypothetical protein TYRP_013274 [Tyrophagus putrescentiae]|nr:hypothetical protein TYRP_013274 [Tyrophagus putrescentiae]